jgi:aminoglycoside/choline kinase family phosphotransferase
VAVTYGGGGDGGLPPTLFVKRNLAELTFPPEMYLTECLFYRDVVSGLDIEVPRIFAMEVDETTGAFLLLMEDLGRRARLGIATEPTTIDEVASVLDDLAALHAPFWGSARLDDELTWLQTAATGIFSRFWQEAGPRLARRHLESGLRADAVQSSPWVHDRLWVAFARLADVVSEAPHTMLHGDVHVGNTYFVPRGRGGLLDWQLMLKGSWSVDVAYLVMTALEPGARADHERELLRHYLGALRSRGVDAPADDAAWTIYRQNAVWGVVMWAVTPRGVHSDEVQAVSLARCVAATEDLGTLALLDA